MFKHSSSAGYTEAISGFRYKTVVHGELTLMAEVRLRTGTFVPRHNHPHEQTGYLVSGRLRLSIGQDSFEAGPGDSWCILRNVPHGAEVLEEAHVIEVFSPVREDYLP